MDNRRLLIAVLLSLAILLGWYYFFPPAEPVRTPPPAAVEPARTPAVADPGPAAGTSAAESSTAASEASPGPAEEAPLEAGAEREIAVEVPQGRLVLTNRGARLVSFTLRGHRDASGGDVELVRRRAGGPYPFSLVGADLAPTPLDDALFAVEEADSPEGRRVTFRYRGPAGAAEKSFEFRDDGLIDVEVRVERPERWRLLLGPGVRNPSTDELESRYQARGGVWRSGEKVERADGRQAEGPVALPGVGLSWVALEDQYFLTAAVVRGGLGGAAFLPVSLQGGGTEPWRFAALPAKEERSKEVEDRPRDLALLLEPDGPALSLRTYWGAKELSRLSDLPYGLDDTVNLGMFWFIARPLLAGLLWIHGNLVANFGWAIVLLTVAIKILLLPLTHKSYVSMRKMQKLAPKMQAIRDRWRGKMKDKQGRPNLEAQRKMNEEVMALYKSEGVNPAGGCLPMLLQLPVLFAFYQLLSVAVELRGAPWLLWITDLSIKDPYYVLPLVMGATQFIQQKMTPMSGDPMQRRIFLMMPVVMTFLFVQFPSGLVLYWLTNNVLTIAQQAVYNRTQGNA